MPGDSQVFSQELNAFMAAIGKQESGGRYHVLGPQTKYGRPRGKYQILDSNWDAWSKAAGIPGADWRDPAAQERVAAYMFTRYYEQYGGRWDAVAVAWFAGPGRAKKFIANPRSVTAMQDVLGTSVGAYVEKAMRQMQVNLGRDPMQSGYQDFSPNAYEREHNPPIEEQVPQDEAIRSVMKMFTNIFGPDSTAPETTAHSSSSASNDAPQTSTSMSERQRTASISDVPTYELRSDSFFDDTIPAPQVAPPREDNPVDQRDIDPKLRATPGRRGVI